MEADADPQISQHLESTSHQSIMSAEIKSGCLCAGIDINVGHGRNEDR
jgi:hypothetical protein